MPKKNKSMYSAQDPFAALLKDRAARQAVTRQSHLLFFHLYFSHYVKYEIAEFQKEIFRITEDATNNLACIVAFRGSGKSTLVTLSYSLWAVLGIQQKKFVMIICQTQSQARQHMANIRSELEHNPLFKSDLGPFREETGGEWAMQTLVFKKNGARITVASVDQSIRGAKHQEHRPDLIILDDVEDLNSTKTLDSRNKTYDWFTREIVPLGDIGTRIMLVGNLLHEDSLMMRLKKEIEHHERDGIFRSFPLLNEQGTCLWPGKFNSPEKIEELHRSVGNEIAWKQEYLLTIVSDSTKVIWPEWITYYDPTTEKMRNGVCAVIIGVDLAISQKDYADYTAIVIGMLRKEEEEVFLDILPNPINKRMSYPQAIELIKDLAKAHAVGMKPYVLVESNGFQRIYAEALSCAGLRVEEIRNTSDKRTRLAMASPHVQKGLIRFPKNGAEELISQITDFGIERHDDLADAFSMVALKFGKLRGNVKMADWAFKMRENAPKTIAGNLMKKKW